MPNENPDSYYRQQSIQAINAAFKEAEGGTEEQIRFAMRRAYPFGPLRKGRPYKQWNKILLAKEAELGYEPKKHRKTKEKEMSNTAVANKPTMVADSPILEVAPSAKEAGSPAWREFLNENKRPVTKELASQFLRNHCQTVIMLKADHDLLRVVLKYSDREESALIKSEYKRELSGDDQDEYEIAYCEAACFAYDLWIESQKAKFN